MKDRIYFPNLNGIRAIAAIVVMVYHIEQLLRIMGKPNYFENRIIMQMGGLGVTLFFVLSGFLISYLLFAEEKKTGTIGIKDFYIRRMLRIWPLYYLIVFLSFFVLPYVETFFLPSGYWERVDSGMWLYLPLFLLFLPNLVLAFGTILPYGSQSWSVGVEEQFYLIWPVLMKFFRNKLFVIVGGIIGYFVVFYLVVLLPNVPRYVISFVQMFQIYSMAIGGLFAYLAFYGKKELQNAFLCKWLFFVAIILFLGLIMCFPNVHKFVYSILFGLIIYNLACNQSLKTALENKILNYLGKISYGLYMYHCIAIVFSIRLLDYILQHIQYNTIQYNTIQYNTIQYNTIQYKAALVILVLITTIILSDISYRFIESRFIGLKTKYSKIISGDNVKKIK